MQTKATAPLLDGSILQEEIDLELHAVDQGVIRYRRLANEAIDRGEGSSLKPAERLLVHWFEPLEGLVADERKAYALGKPGTGRVVAGPVLRLLRAEQLAVITMQVVVSECMKEPAGVQFNRLTHQVGKAVFCEIHRRRLRVEKKLKDLEQRYRKIEPNRVNWWAKKNLEDPLVSKKAAHHVGAILIDCLMRAASCSDYVEDVFVPAFEHFRTYRGIRKIGMIRMADRAFEIIDDGHAVRWAMRPRYLPMIVPPYPWPEGGYVKIRTPFISKPTKTQKEALAKGDLTKIYQSLYDIGVQGWRLNRRVLEVQRRLWEAGGGVCGIPHAADRPRLVRPVTAETDAAEKKRWKKEASKVYRENLARQSERAVFLQVMAVADMYEHRPAFYYPHQLDFRGRCYPIPVHLNHQGGDVCRGLLEFSEGKDVDTEEARGWLLIHAANCWGFDKASYDDRKKWATDRMKMIRAVAADPIAEEWWHGAEKPWQFLAACFAICDPAAARHLPVQLDGTCNGLQHYAAIGRDSTAAAAVNMLPAGAPSDVYSNVTNESLMTARADANAGNQYALKCQNYIDRKVCKPPTMTKVYGVTMVGAREQIHTALVEAGMPNDGLYDTSRYLSAVVMDSIGRVCVSAKEIMDWLRDCAKRITEKGHPVQWTTPLGLPVVQPYRNYQTCEIRTVVQRIKIVNCDEDVPVKRRKQVDGVAPNYIHSIDSTHMLMTAMACREKGIAFAEVHDSYWTHAATCGALGVTLREQFVALHSRDLLKELVEQWRAQMPDVEFPDPPKRGSYDLNLVMESPDFFS